MNWLSRLKTGLSKTSQDLSGGIAAIFTKRKLDDAALEELEELLIRADVGASAASAIVGEFAKGRFDKEISADEVRAALAELIAARLEAVAKPLEISGAKPHVIVVVGVNGNGKTTTIGKLAAQFQSQGHSVMLAAADTFRAAAVEQLSQWAQRVGCPIVTAPPESDPASVAYQALERARAEGIDVLLIDTAGRLQNKANLMEELKKLLRVLQKIDADAPHHVLQVLDATTGQNALAQAQAFRDVAAVTGLIITKLDGTAKAGIVVALADKFALPIHAIGVGESIEDLHAFEANSFAMQLLNDES